MGMSMDVSSGKCDYQAKGDKARVPESNAKFIEMSAFCLASA
jgi:hypothetical protein